MIKDIQKWKSGDLIAIPIDENRYVLGLVIDFAFSPGVIATDQIMSKPFSNQLLIESNRIISASYTGRMSLDEGDWEVSGPSN
ncbi:hypothetical protein KNO30_04785 [Taylorella equigenitalis]|uniref:hypothetical protein n=1 Tax=Taylorella equigenitalis TaxID=29575 RepID=UPI00040E66DF|nr:hypothetical protein [Taylorella equigenitalis]ASY30692.1 hypothetical protein B9Z30_04825 [Taylorella equigenitalis]KOS58303.1 hypothetical protein AM589_07615 [Taylorella equigenitalis]WDU47370.1 hypothetical protein KNO30_04785 [Taylorella equigenitalis]